MVSDFFYFTIMEFTLLLGTLNVGAFLYLSQGLCLDTIALRRSTLGFFDFVFDLTMNCGTLYTYYMNDLDICLSGSQWTQLDLSKVQKYSHKPVA